MCPRRRLSLKTLLLLLIVLLSASIVVLTLILAQSLIEHSTGPKSKRGGSSQVQYVDRNGMHVVVGRYVGSSLEDSRGPNFTWQELHEHQFRPIGDHGRNGEPVFLPERQHALARRLWHLHKFNVLVSDSIPLNRSLPDVRNNVCVQRDYMQSEGSVTQLSTASIIIVFHNEAWSTLLRTVYSVLLRSDPRLVDQLILVDDASDRTYLKSPLEEHLQRHVRPQHPQVEVKVLRLPTRQGLVQARLQGAALAGAPVLVFLDAHCEATKGWLEPLLDHIKTHPNSVVCPVIDVLHDDHFGYVKSFALHWGAFNWALHFRWFTMPSSLIESFKRDPTQPYPTPIMAGGLFAVRKTFFNDLGGYDKALFLWGGENLELSFKAWRCSPNGSVVIAPCSHVGHVFRKASPYTFIGGMANVLHNNLARVTKVWADGDYRNFFLKVNPHVGKAAAQIANIDDELELKDKLKCKSMKWYLDNVWPQHFLPTHNGRFGHISLSSSSLCLHKPLSDGRSDSNQMTGAALLATCVSDFDSIAQLFVITNSGLIMGDENVCLDAPTESQEASVRFQNCMTELDRQQWVIDNEGQVIQKSSKLCLTAAKGAISDHLILEECNLDKARQVWSLISVEWR